MGPGGGSRGSGPLGGAARGLESYLITWKGWT